MLHIYHFAKSSFNWLMNLTIDEIRRENLLLLIQESGGKRSTLADNVGTNPAYISQLLTPNEEKRRDIGDELARRLEEAYKKPRGWMDQSHVTGQLSATLDGVSGRIEGKIAPPIESNVDQSLSDFSSLMAVASPRTHAILQTIEQADRDGKLTEEDAKLLETIAKRLTSDKSR